MELSRKLSRNIILMSRSDFLARRIFQIKFFSYFYLKKQTTFLNLKVWIPFKVVNVRNSLTHK